MNIFLRSFVAKIRLAMKYLGAKVQQLFHIPVIFPNIFLSDVSDLLTMSDVSRAIFVPLCYEQCHKTFVRLS